MFLSLIPRGDSQCFLFLFDALTLKERICINNEWFTTHLWMMLSQHRLQQMLIGWKIGRSGLLS